LAVALVVAAGRGERLETPVPKAFVMLAGRPMVEWSIAALRDVAAIEQIVVALPPGVDAPAGTIGVEGGAERSHSVRAALAAAADDDVVIVHDAARPLVSAELVVACLDALATPTRRSPRHR
jgi:2-C-methyl-D-erythritol 4-phosphate cytidylyltransferase